LRFRVKERDSRLVARVSRRASTPETNCEPVTTASGTEAAVPANFGAQPAYMSGESPKFGLDRSSNCVLPTMALVCATASRLLGSLGETAAVCAEQPRDRRGPYRRNGAECARCRAWLVHRRTDSHAQQGDEGVGALFNSHVPTSRRQPRWLAIGWTSLVLWNAAMRSRRPQQSISRTADRERAPVCQRRLMPERSGAAEGVGDGRRPAPVQIDHSRRRGPFSGL